MKNNKLSSTVFIGSLLFGLFFGAGNLIFPVLMGQTAASQSPLAFLGFLATATGLPFLAVVAMGVSQSNSLSELGNKVHPTFSLFFTILLYLTIGPLFALPRTASVSFEVGISPLIQPQYQRLFLAGFSILFFAIALFFALRPSNILVWVGKILNPIFLLFLAVLFLQGFINPIGGTIPAPVGDYSKAPFLTGFLEGYNTMDLLAALAFGSIVITEIKKSGITKPKQIAGQTIKSGSITVLLMTIIYGSLTYLGARSVGVYGVAANGGQALAVISKHYFGSLGSLFLAATITIACLKTAIGLITSCSNTFIEILPFPIPYPIYAILFTLSGCFVANVGLNKIISLSIPVLRFLYPLAIGITFVALLSPWLGQRTVVYRATVVGAFIAGIGDMIYAMPKSITSVGWVTAVINAYSYLPFFTKNMGWILPTSIGFIIGLIWSICKKDTGKIKG